eukprot:g1537.t1
MKGDEVEKTKEAILYRMFRAHDAAITAAIIVRDDEGHQELVTASLDNTVAYWRLNHLELHKSKLDSFRVSSYYPVLSLTGDSDRAKYGTISVYCGRAKANDILCWDQPPNAGFNPRVILNDQSSWVQDLKSIGRWMFSTDCNKLRQWDLSYAMPRHVRDVSIIKGNILCMACGRDRIFAGVSDGSIHAWRIAKTGELKYTGSCYQAHKDRVTALAWDKQGVLYSAGTDGCIRSWTGEGLEAIRVRRNAHNGKKVNCLAVGPSGVLYSGGEDHGLIKRWNGKQLSPCQQPLFCHKHPVRVLSFGKANSLISGDSNGVVSIWKV